MKKDLGKLVIIYEKVTSFEKGGVARILDYDATSRGEFSYFVLPMEFDHKENLKERLNNSRWVRSSDIKVLVNCKRGRWNRLWRWLTRWRRK